MAFKFTFVAIYVVAVCSCFVARGMPIVTLENAQPLVSSTSRLVKALEYLGNDLGKLDQKALNALSGQAPSASVAEEIQKILDTYCLAYVHINPEARVKVRRGPAEPTLIQDGWKSYLVKVHNESGTRAPLECDSPNAEPALHESSGQPRPKERNAISPGELSKRFLEVHMFDKLPLDEGLSGAPVEYRILQLYTRETGQREAILGFHVGQGTEDLGHRNSVPFLFECKSSVKVKLRVRDSDGKPTMASFIFRDNVERFKTDTPNDKKKGDYRNQRALAASWENPGVGIKPLLGVYPLPSRRIADHDEFPDFYFQPQIYRGDGEHIYLPPGTYDVTWTRGPEYLPQSRAIIVGEGPEQEEVFELKRWIRLTDFGWYSGDHHVHAGGCSHYESPEAGVKPEAMFRQAQGEDLNVACVLTWGPCWYHQKSFFEGKVHALSTPEYLMRYDVEVSGFPSSHAGHVVLLRLTEDDYPGTTLIEEWPSWTQPVLQWAKDQGGVVGYAHSGWGLEPEDGTTLDLPNYVMPNMNGIGANEFIVTTVTGACDFISAGNTPIPWELNIWYHTLNCGFRSAISGETDYPCIFDDRIGMARSYAKLGEKLDFDTFAQELKNGNIYVSDGLSHLIDFSVGDAQLGSNGNTLNIAATQTLPVKVKVAAYLEPEQSAASEMIAKGGVRGRPYWHLEKARIEKTRRVPVELIVNGAVAQRQEIEADGAWHDVAFSHNFEKSSWVAVRILPSSHTNPIFVHVADAPIRASRKSAEWCRAAVDKCWEQKKVAIREGELAAAESAYNQARAAYDAAIKDAVGE